MRAQRRIAWGLLAAAAMMAALVVMPAAAFAYPDVEDPGDAAIANAVAAPAVGDIANYWRFASPTDVDWRSFTATEGVTYQIDLYDDDATYTIDPYIELYRWSGGTTAPQLLISANDTWRGRLDDPPARDATMWWTCPSTNTYYLRLTARSGMGWYTLELIDRGTFSTPAAHRIGSGDRYGIARQVAAAVHPGWAGIDTVIVASGLDRSAADALAVSGLAGLKNAPVLLINQDSVTHSLPYATRTAIGYIEGVNKGAIKYYLVGGTASTPDWLVDRIRRSCPAAGNAVFERLYGSDRYACSARIASEIRSESAAEGHSLPTTCVVANGETPAFFYDALAAAPFAYHQHWPILLTRKWSVPAQTATEERRANYTSTLVAGDAAEVSNYCVGKLGGTRVGDPARNTYNRSSVARAIAEGLWSDEYQGVRHDVFVANRLPDALTGGTLAGSTSLPSPLLISMGIGDPGTDTTDYIQQVRRWVLDDYYLLGGTLSISAGQAAKVAYNAGRVW